MKMDQVDQVIMNFNQILSDIFIPRMNPSLEQLQQETGEQFLINLICLICKKFMKEAVYLNCSHRFCKRCIQRSKRLNGILQCPICKIQCQVEHDDNIIAQIHKIFNNSLNQIDKIAEQQEVQSYKNQKMSEHVNMNLTGSTNTTQQNVQSIKQQFTFDNKNNKQIIKQQKLSKQNQLQQIEVTKNINSTKSPQQIQKIIKQNTQLYLLQFCKKMDVTNFIFKMIQSRVFCPIQSKGRDIKTHISHKLGLKNPCHIQYLMVRNLSVKIKDDESLFQVIDKSTKRFNFQKKQFQYEQKDIIQIVYNINPDIIIDTAQQEAKKQEKPIQ